MRLRGVLLVVVAVGAGGLVVPAAAAPPRANGWIVTRTAPGAAVLTGTMSATARGAGATVGMFALTGRGARRTHDSAFTTTRVDWGSDGWVSVYGHAVTSPECVSVTCADPAATPVTVRFSSNGHRIASDVYVAGWDADTAVTVTSPGWRVRPWRPGMRVVRGDEGGGTGARAIHTTAGTFTSAEAAGGRYGSFAFASLPCGMTGEGSGTFSGGSRTFDLACGGRRSWRTGAPGPARWRLAGESWGVDGIVNVLVVVDYPR